MSGRLELTAHCNKVSSGWAIITHPFHPQLGKKFLVLKTRKLASTEMLTLQSDSGNLINIPKEWTDLAEPTPYQCLNIKPTILSFDCLIQLTELIENINKSDEL
ncbi:MAG: DUF5372 family protein [Gammaproteobacteria bacterium]|nr:DUF5372 family protein [Gammaproteobacteria bacterium]